MEIQKGEKIYTVEEKPNLWMIACKVSTLTIEYKVPKDICADEAQLRAYIEQEKIF